MTSAGVLDGVRILAVENFMAGPYGSMLLADAGADVIKVEAPSGDGSRHVARFLRDAAGKNQSAAYVRFNRNKRSIVLDLKNEHGRELLRQLSTRTDVIWENFRAGVMDRLGLGYGHLREENPRLIYTSVSGYGHADTYASPYIDRPAFDMAVQAIAGLMLRAGRPDDPPFWLGFPLGDLFPSVLAAYGTVLALWHRERTGLGQHVDIAMYDAAVMLNERAVTLAGLTGRAPLRGADTFMAPYGPFKARDGYVAVAVASEVMWQRLCQVLGRPDLARDPRLQNGDGRHTHLESIVRPALEGWLAQRSRGEAVDELLRVDVAAAPVQHPEELFTCPHLAARHMLPTVRYADRDVHVVGNAVKLSGVPEPPLAPPPRVGEHQEAVLEEILGLAANEVAALRSAGAFG